MAMRRFVQFIYGLEKKQVRLFANATVGAAGAITLNSPLLLSQGIASITKLATAGQYRITLKDSYMRLIGIDTAVISATGIPASGTIGVLTTGTNVAALGGGTIVVQLSAAGVATNPASGDVLLIEIVLGDSSV